MFLRHFTTFYDILRHFTTFYDIFYDNPRKNPLKKKETNDFFGI